MGDALKPTGTFTVKDSDNDGTIDAGEAVTVTSPVSGKSQTFKAGATPPAEPIQIALQDLGINPKSLVGTSIPLVSRFAADASAYYSTYVATIPTDAQRNGQDHALQSLQDRSQMLPFAYTPRVGELMILPAVKAIEKKMQEENVDLSSLSYYLNQLSYPCDHLQVTIPRLATRLQGVITALLDKTQASLTAADAAPAITNDVVNSLHEVNEVLAKGVDIAAVTGSRTPALAVRWMQQYTQLMLILTSKKDRFFAHFDACARDTPVDTYLYELGHYLDILEDLKDRDIPGADALYTEANQRYGALRRYTEVMTSAKYANRSIEDRIAALMQAIGIRKEFDADWQTAPGLAKDVIHALSGTRVSDTRELAVAAAKAGLNLTPFQQSFVLEGINTCNTSIGETINAYSDRAADTSVPTAARTLDTLSISIKTLESLKAVAKTLIPPETPRVNTKPLYAKVYALLANEAFLAEAVRNEVDYVAWNFPSNPDATLRDAQHYSQTLKKLHKTYASLLKNGAQLGAVYPKETREAALEPVLAKVEAKFDQAQAYCTAWKEAATTFARSEATPDEKKASIAAVRTAAQAVGFTDVSFLDRIIVVDPAAPPAAP